MLHVLQTIHSLHSSKGGPSRTVTQLSAALREQPETNVSIICGDASGIQHQSIVTGNIYASVRNELTMGGIRQNIIHDNGLWRQSNAMAALAAKRSGVPLIISPHGMLEPWAMEHHRFRKHLAMALYQSWCLRHAAAFHATCPEEAESIRRAGCTQPIAVVGNGIETVPASVDRVFSGSRIALFLSRLHEKKGVLELITAWSRLKPTGWLLRIVGPDDGGHLQIVKKMISDLGVTESIQLRGEVNDQEKWAEYKQAELFILPTHSENFGLVIGEALASGLPVITTTATPWTQIATKQCGWVIDPDLNQLCSTLRQASSLSREQLVAMGEIGRQWIPSEFSWQNIARQMHEFYSWVTDGMSSSSVPDFIV